MSGRWGWALAALLMAVATLQFGWQGAVMAASVCVFWLLLQFSRVLRVMRVAAQHPKGRVPSAVALHARLHRGMRLIDVLALTRSLGEAVSTAPEVWRWTDAGGAAVQLTMAGGRCQHWTLERPGEENSHEDGPAEARPAP